MLPERGERGLYFLPLRNNEGGGTAEAKPLGDEISALDAGLKLFSVIKGQYNARAKTTTQEALAANDWETAAEITTQAQQFQNNLQDLRTQLEALAGQHGVESITVKPQDLGFSSAPQPAPAAEAPLKEVPLGEITTEVVKPPEAESIGSQLVEISKAEPAPTRYVPNYQSIVVEMLLQKKADGQGYLHWNNSDIIKAILLPAWVDEPHARDVAVTQINDLKKRLTRRMERICSASPKIATDMMAVAALVLANKKTSGQEAQVQLWQSINANFGAMAPQEFVAGLNRQFKGGSRPKEIKIFPQKTKEAGRQAEKACSLGTNCELIINPLLHNREVKERIQNLLRLPHLGSFAAAKGIIKQMMKLGDNLQAAEAAALAKKGRADRETVLTSEVKKQVGDKLWQAVTKIYQGREAGMKVSYENIGCRIFLELAKVAAKRGVTPENFFEIFFPKIDIKYQCDEAGVVSIVHRDGA